jgi:hypothetical protein
MKDLIQELKSTQVTMEKKSKPFLALEKVMKETQHKMKQLKMVDQLAQAAYDTDM